MSEGLWGISITQAAGGSRWSLWMSGTVFSFTPSLPACLPGANTLRLGLHSRVPPLNSAPASPPKTHPIGHLPLTEPVLVGGPLRLMDPHTPRYHPGVPLFLTVHGVFCRPPLPQGQADSTCNHKLAEEKRISNLRAVHRPWRLPPLPPQRAYLWSGAQETRRVPALATVPP